MAARSLWMLAAVSLATAGPGWAADKRPDPDAGYSRTYKTCVDRSGGVTVTMRECISAEAGRQDAALNAAYRTLMDKIEDPARKQQLREAQRAWIAFRKADCEFAADLQNNGTAGPLIIDGCFLDMTVRRVQDLKTSIEAEL